MSEKHVNGECSSCESSFHVAYVEELVSSDLPEHCPFCGEQIEDISESYIEDDSDEEDAGEWE
jgi:hypothetical protein